MTTRVVADEDIRLIHFYRQNWIRFIAEILRATLDEEQEKIVNSVQRNRRTITASGHARGKDFVAACCGLTFSHLYFPSKVVMTAPTQRQVDDIMMAEVATLHRQAHEYLERMEAPPLGSFLQARKMTYPGYREWYLEGFKAQDKATEAWTGYHSENVMVIVTEASGIADETATAIEGLLTGNSRLLKVGNPNHLSGDFFNAFQDPTYEKFKLNCLHAPNVVAKRIIYPGQVDWQWVEERVDAWCKEIPKYDYKPEKYHDFEWEGKLYRPDDRFLVKVLGEFPSQSSMTLIPLPWIDAAFKRYESMQKKGFSTTNKAIIGADIAGMGRDQTVITPRFGSCVLPSVKLSQASHMENCGTIIRVARDYDVGVVVNIDTIGEGAGVYDRAQELIEEARMGARRDAFLQHHLEVQSAKFSFESDQADETQQLQFANMRAQCYWAFREHLDPDGPGPRLAIPPSDSLKQELNATKFKFDSQGRILIVPKEKIQSEIGRSPDEADSIALTYFPIDPRLKLRGIDADRAAQSPFKGVGIF